MAENHAMARLFYFGLKTALTKYQPKIMLKVSILHVLRMLNLYIIHIQNEIQLFPSQHNIICILHTIYILCNSFMCANTT